jgi:hypothetical protein
MGQKGRGWDRELPEGFEEWRDNGRNKVRRCWARAKGTGEQCTQPAASGQKVCRFHGAAARQNLAKGKERVIERRAAALVATYGIKIQTSATEALLEEVQWTAGHVAWLRERVQEIESSARIEGTDREHPLVWGVTKEKSGGEDRGTTKEAVPNVWLRLYQQERDHLVKVCSAAIKAGIEERRIQLAEQQGALVAQAIRAILGDLQLTPEQQARVPEVVPRHLRALASA